MKNLFSKRLFEKLNLSDADVILVISSLHNAFEDASPSEAVRKIWNIYGSLKDIANKDRLLVFPAFTYSFTRTKVFDLKQSPPESMGALSKIAFREKSFFRTPSPMTSFLMWPSPPKMRIDTTSSTFGNTSLFGWLQKKKCRIILIGDIPDNELGWLAVHHCEEVSKVPYRSFKTFKGRMIVGSSSSVKHTQLHYARILSMNVQNDYTELNQKLRNRKKRIDFKVENVNISSAWCHDIIKIAKEILAEDPYGLTNLSTNFKNDGSKSLI